jgi:tripartite-type tricarboxylate transporter receptor subunit TctC
MSGWKAEMRRRLLLAGLALPAAARAQETPRGARIIVPYGPGGSSDIVARILAQHASGAGNQSFVVENRGGGASIPGTQAVVSAPPDGGTIGTADNALVVNQALFKDRMAYRVERDIAAIGLAVTAPSLLLAYPAAPARTVAEVLDEARRTPGGLSLSHGGIGTPTHLAALQFQMASQAPITQVGYRGGGPQLTGLVAGEVRYGFVSISSSFNHVEGGRLRPLAITGPARSPRLPDVPTVTEAGLPGVDVVGWWGFIGPSGLSPALIERLHAQLVAPAKKPAVRARLEELGYSVIAGSPDDFATQIRREIPFWAEVFEKAGVKPDQAG